MGCDIHTYKEKRQNGAWVSCDTWEISKEYEDDPARYERAWPYPTYHSRNYVQFGLMAGVRWSSPHTVQPKGAPDDASMEVQREIEQWDCDGHSHSWLTLREMKELAAKVLVSRTDENHSHALEGLNNLIQSVDEEGVSPDDIRVVFFFDN